MINFLNSIFQKAEILVVDDDRLYREFLSRILARAGITNIKTAENGKQAIEKTIEHTPDIVILDLQMPESDGYEYCRYIRKKPQFKSMPILVQTGVQSTKDRLKAFDIGANDMITKPVEPRELLARIKVHLENKFLFDKMQNYQIKVKTELKFAGEMQKTLLPSLKSIKECEERYNIIISHFFKSSLDIGGDLWGLKPISNDKFALYVCDFSGHGVSAALNVFRFHAMVDEITQDFKSPAEYLDHLNKKMRNLLSIGQFATMFMVIIDVKENIISYSAAGSPTPLLIKNKGKKINFINADGFPLGVVDNPKYKSKEINFHKKDRFFLYSDALTEAHFEQGEIMEDEDLAEITSYFFSMDLPDKEKNSAFIPFLMDYAMKGETKLSDDLTMILCTRL